MGARYVLVACSIACGSVDANKPDAAIDAPADVAIDAPLPPCDPTMSFGTPTVVPGAINTSGDQFSFRMSSDALSAIVGRTITAGVRLHIATRPSLADDFGMPVL